MSILRRGCRDTSRFRLIKTLSCNRLYARRYIFPWKGLLLSTIAGLSTYNYINNYSICNLSSVLAETNQNQNQNEPISNPKIAVITGGASGIGKGIAFKCGKEKFDTIIIIDINESNSNQTKQELSSLYPNTNIITFIADTTNKQNIERIVSDLKTKYNIHKISHLFNNAGISPNCNVYDNTQDNLHRLHRIMDINFWSHIYCTQLFLPFLGEYDNQSYIINTASLAAIFVGGGMYSITKHAIAAYSETLTHELQAQDKYKDIQIFCLCPGFVATDLLNNSADIVNEKDKDKLEIAKNASEWINKIGITPEECADKVFESIEKGEFWVFPHTQEAHYAATIRYQSWITRKNNQKEFEKQIRPNYDQFSWERT